MNRDDVVEAWVALKEWLEPVAGDNCDLKASQNEVETFNAMERAVASLSEAQPEEGLVEALKSIERHAVCPVGHPKAVEMIASEARKALEGYGCEYDRLKAQKDDILSKRHDADANKAGGLWYRRWRAAQDEIKRLTALSRNHDEALERAAKVARDYGAKARSRGWVTNPESAAKAADHIATAIRALKGDSK